MGFACCILFASFCVGALRCVRLFRSWLIFSRLGLSLAFSAAALRCDLRFMRACLQDAHGRASCSSLALTAMAACL